MKIDVNFEAMREAREARIVAKTNYETVHNHWRYETDSFLSEHDTPLPNHEYEAITEKYYFRMNEKLKALTETIKVEQELLTPLISNHSEWVESEEIMTQVFSLCYDENKYPSLHPYVTESIYCWIRSLHPAFDAITTVEPSTSYSDGGVLNIVHPLVTGEYAHEDVWDIEQALLTKLQKVLTYTTKTTGKKTPFLDKMYDDSILLEDSSKVGPCVHVKAYLNEDNSCRIVKRNRFLPDSEIQELDVSSISEALQLILNNYPLDMEDEDYLAL